MITQNLIFLNWYQHAKNKAISNDLIWRFQSFKNTAIWLAESILAHISGTRFLPNIDYVQKHRLWNSHYRHSWQRFLTHLFYEDPPPPPILPTPTFSNFGHPLLTNLHSRCPFCWMILWLNGWSHHIWQGLPHRIKGRKNGKLCRGRSFFIKCVTIWWGVILTIIKISMACM